ncbi:hypothetical protein DAI22_01g350350 [Oryza sativa Japonica Group]|nr:hypothetical protein DAI22_01g350350 [Oryza sativa Japonica Group]
MMISVFQDITAHLNLTAALRHGLRASVSPRKFRTGQGNGKTDRYPTRKINRLFGRTKAIACSRVDMLYSH